MLVDERQRYPPVRDMVRRDVDRRSQPGRYLLTGSAEPTSAPTHSGAGRIVTVRMRPLSLAERDLVPIGVSLGEMLSGRRPPISGEVDLIVQGFGRKVVAIEVTLSGTVEDREVRHLRWLAERPGEGRLTAEHIDLGSGCAEIKQDDCGGLERRRRDLPRPPRRRPHDRASGVRGVEATSVEHHVGAADPGEEHPEAHLTLARVGVRDLGDPERSGTVVHDGSHGASSVGGASVVTVVSGRNRPRSRCGLSLSTASHSASPRAARRGTNRSPR